MSYNILSKENLQYVLGKLKEKIDDKTGGGVDVEVTDDMLVFSGGQNSNEVKLATSGSDSSAIRFGVDSDGNYGYYKVGADTLTPFKTGASLQSYDIFNHGDIVGLRDVVILPAENVALNFSNFYNNLSASNANAGQTIYKKVFASDMSYIYMQQTYYKYIIFPYNLAEYNFTKVHFDIEITNGRTGAYNNSYLTFLQNRSTISPIQLYMTSYSEGRYTAERQVYTLDIPKDDDITALYPVVFNCDCDLYLYSIWAD